MAAAAKQPLRILMRSSVSVSPARRTLTTRSLRPSSTPTRWVQTATYHPAHSFSYTSTPQKGLQPDTSDPSPPKTEPHVSSSNTEPTPLSEDTYHEKADSYLDRLVLALEEKAESNPDFEVEYDSGTLELSTPSGTYVINKQRPNKQIWLSSPVSGPKRYDFVSGGAGQHEKEDSDAGNGGGGGGGLHGEEMAEGDDGVGGRWVYLRDGTGLSALLWREVGVKARAEGREGGGG